MRLVTLTVWWLTNLLFFGVCAYFFIIVSQFVTLNYDDNGFGPSDEEQFELSIPSTDTEDADLDALQKLPVSKRSNSKIKRSATGANFIKTRFASTKRSNRNEITEIPIITRAGNPRFPNTQTPILELDSLAYVCTNLTSPECSSRTATYKKMLSKELNRVIVSESRQVRSGRLGQNQYNVQYEAIPGRIISPRQVLCALASVPVKTVTAKDEPFARLGFPIPEKPLRQGESYDTCAVVMSAGALLGSGHGKFIDSHDMVVRFNNAPTAEYADDVGTKTTFRILNSQVVTKPEYSFTNNSLFDNVSILIWDPANSTATLEEWYRYPEYSLFNVYKKALEMKPGADIHLLNPKLLWDLWLILQDSSKHRLRRNPPSSGFIGVWFALQRCKIIRIFEFVPSTHATRVCHYYSTIKDSGCTLGSWHPLSHEKALTDQFRTNSDLEAYQLGYVEIPGLADMYCPE